MRIVSYCSFLSILLMLVACKKDLSLDTNIDTVLDIRIDRDPVKLNPIVYPKVVVRQINNNVFLPLADRDPETLEFVPILIREIPTKIKNADGGVSFNLEIRPDAVWPNGSDITAYDYLFTIKAISHPLVNAPAYRSAVRKISNVAVNPTNNKAFTVTLYEDYLLALETVVTLEVYPEYAYDSAACLKSIALNFLQNEENVASIKSDSTLVGFAEAMNSPRFGQEIVVGAGPYAFVSYEENKYVKLRKVPNYWGLKYPEIKSLHAEPEEIVFHVVPDLVNAVSLIKEGSIDFIGQLDGSSYENLQSSEYSTERLDLYTAEMPRIYYLMLNTQSPQLGEVLVRKALYHLVDIPTIINVLETGKGNIVKSPIRPTAAYYLESLPDPTFNPEKAASLLDQAGWKDTDNDGIRDKIVNGEKVQLSLKMSATPKGLSGDIAQIMKADAATIGVEIELIEKSPSLFREENIKTGDFHIAAQASSQYLSLYDPYQTWHSNNAYKGSNYSGYVNQELDKVIEAIQGSDNVDTLTPLYHEFQRILYDDLPHLYLYSPLVKMAARKPWTIQPTVKRPGYYPNTATFNLN